MCIDRSIDRYKPCGRANFSSAAQEWLEPRCHAKLGQRVLHRPARCFDPIDVMAALS